ncbi:proteinase-activated receptor 1-like [Garra rufa]|uniref:proteinase-activated receptor 1-like n=1 Tax=Garra rufa TaxID=137080 RepID=UPI003CCED1C6
MFMTNNSALTNQNQTTSSGPLFAQHEVVLLYKGLTVTRIMPLIYTFILLLSLPLNGLALVTFTCKIREKNPAVIYMSHLACVDLLFTLLLPLKIHYRMNGTNWVFGEAACRFLNAAYYCNMYCSILLMMCMSVDRLLAVVFPITSRTWRSTRKATCICTLVWLLALTGIVPLLTLRQTITFQNLGVTCLDFLEDDSIEMLYLCVFLIIPCIYFFLPLVIILVSYSTIIYVLCTKLDYLLTSSSSSDNRWRAAIMATAVLTEFVVCFVPSNAMLLYHLVTCLVTGSCRTDTYLAYVLAVCLGSSSVFLDPLLYYYGSSQYRKQIRSVFWLCKAKKANIP